MISFFYLSLISQFGVTILEGKVENQVEKKE